MVCGCTEEVEVSNPSAASDAKVRPARPALPDGEADAGLEWPDVMWRSESGETEEGAEVFDLPNSKSRLAVLRIEIPSSSLKGATSSWRSVCQTGAPQM